METDYILMVLQFIHNLYGAYFLWFYELGPIVIPIALAQWIAIYYVGYKLFVDWRLDYRCWRAGGIATSSFNTSQMNLNYRVINGNNNRH